MVVRPESPVNVTSAQEDSDLFRDYMWMNDSEKFDEEYLEELFHQDPPSTRQSSRASHSSSQQSHTSSSSHHGPTPSQANDNLPHVTSPLDTSSFNNNELEELLQQGLNRVVEELEREPTNGTSTEQARPSPVEATPEILTKSNLNPDAQEFVPSSPPSR